MVVLFKILPDWGDGWIFWKVKCFMDLSRDNKATRQWETFCSYFGLKKIIFRYDRMVVGRRKFSQSSSSITKGFLVVDNSDSKYILGHSPTNIGSEKRKQPPWYFHLPPCHFYTIYFLLERCELPVRFWLWRRNRKKVSSPLLKEW